jgi:nucleotide-binding universal stress UspA family protein
LAFTSILCPVDFSTHSREAIRHAGAVARRSGGRLTVLFVNDPLLLMGGSRSSGGRKEFIQRTRLELERFVKRSIGVRHQHDIALVVDAGNPADEIMRTAKRLRNDLIVMGTHGLSGFQKLFFGSTTEQVLRRAAIPVLAIPPSPQRGAGKTQSMVIKRVITPVDLVAEWQADVIRAANVAASFDAELIVVHVLAPIQTPPWLRSVGATTGRQRRETAARVLERVIAKLPSGLTKTFHVLEGSPAHEIAQLTTGPQSLVVMSLRGGAGVWGARRGAIAYHVLTHSSTAVLALPRRRLGGHLVRRLSTAVTSALSERDKIEMAGIDALLSAGAGRRRART